MKRKQHAEDYIEVANKLAENYHKGQFRKDGKTPYITHPRQVFGLLKENEVKDRIVLAASLLHDVLEDTPISRTGLFLDLTQNGVTPDKATAIVDLVDQMSSPDKQLSVTSLFNRHTRKSMMARHFRYVSPEAAAIKIADRYCNLSDLDTIDDDEFKLLYAKESIKLVVALKSRIHGLIESLQPKFTKLCNDIVKTCNGIIHESNKYRKPKKVY